jgi:TP901 family phage tail tape measure protein
LADEEVRVKISATGLADFMGDMRSADKAVSDFVTKIGQAGDVASKGFTRMGSSATDATGAVNAFAKAGGQVAQAGDNLSKSVLVAGSSFTKSASDATSFGSKLASIGGSIVGGAVAGLEKLGSAISAAGGHLISLGGSAVSAAVNGFQSLGGAAGAAIGKITELGLKALESGAHIASGFVKSSIDAFGSFNEKLNEVNAVAEVTPQEMKAMRDEAIKLGADLPVSASQAAEGFTELAKAGFNANEVIAAGPGLATLAVAGQLDMGQSAAILSGAIRGFGLSAGDANHVVDLLAKTANASSVDVKDLGVSFKYVAPVAHAAGFSIEDMSVALGIMGNNMIKGSQAGTSLRSIITGLTAPTNAGAKAMQELGLQVTNSDGTIKPFNSLIGDLRSKFKDLSQEQQISAAKTIVGKEAMSGFLSIVNASDADFANMTDAIHKADGAGQTMANTMMKSMKGAIENMKGSIEAFQIKVGEIFAPLVVLGANTVAALANKFGDLTDKLAKSGTAASKSFMSGFSLGTSGSMADMVGQMQKPTSELTVIGFQLAQAFKPLVTTFHELMVALSPVSDASDRFGKTSTETSHRLTEFHPVIAMIGSIVSTVLVPALKTGFDAFTSFRAGLKGIDTNQLSGAGKVFNEIGLAVSSAVKQFGPMIETFAKVAFAISPVRLAIETLVGFLQGGTGGALDAFEEGLVRIGGVFGIDLVPAINIFNTSVLPVLITGFQNAGNFISNTFLPALGNIGNFINTVVLPAIQTFGNWLSTNIGPIFASIGQTMQTTVIPAMQQFGEFIMNTVVPAVQQLAIWIGNNVVPVIEKFAGFIASTVVPIVGQLAAFIMNQVIPVVFQFAQGIAAFLQPILERVSAFIQSTVIPALTQIGAFIQSTVIPALTQIYEYISANVMPIFITVAGFLGGALANAFSFIADVVTVQWNIISTVISTVWGVLSGIFNAIVGFLNDPLTPAFNTLSDVVSTVWNAISGFISSAWDTVSGIFNNITSFMSGTLGPAFSTLSDTVSSVWNAISGFVSMAWDTISGIFDTIVSVVGSTLTNAWNTLSTTVGTVWDTITSAVSGAVDAVGKKIDEAVKFIGAMPGNALSAMGDVASTLLSAGKDLVNGFINGIKSMAQSVLNAVKDTIGGVGDFAKGLLGIHSPSTVMAEQVGKPIAQGMAKGISDNKNLPKEAAKQTALDILSEAEKVISSISKSVDSGISAISKLKDYTAANMDAVNLFAHDLTNIVLIFQGAAANFNEKGLEATGKFTDAAYKITAGIENALKGLGAINSYRAVNQDVVNVFVQDLINLTLLFEGAAQNFEEKGLAAATGFAEAVGKITGVIGTGVKAFTDLATYKTVADGQIRLFITDLEHLIDGFVDSSGQFEEKGLKAAALFADAAGKVVGIIGNGAKAFTELAQYKKVPPQAIQDFVDDVSLAVQLASEAAAKMNGDMLIQVGKFGDAVGKIFAGFKAAMEVFAGLREFKSTPSTIIQEFINEVIFTVGLATTLTKIADSDLIEQTVKFSEAITKIFSGLKSALELFKTLSEFKGIPPEQIQLLLDAITKAIQLMAKAEGSSEQFKMRADAFQQNMKAGFLAIREAASMALNAAQQAAQALAQTNAIPNPPEKPPPSGGSGGGGGGGGGQTPPGKAEGGIIGSAGVYLVGEKGPEIVFLPKGASVLKNEISMQLLGGMQPVSAVPSQSQIYNSMSSNVNSRTYAPQYNLNVHSQQSTGDIVTDFAIMKALA